MRFQMTFQGGGIRRGRRCAVMSTGKRVDAGASVASAAIETMAVDFFESNLLAEVLSHKNLRCWRQRMAWQCVEGETALSLCDLPSSPVRVGNLPTAASACTLYRQSLNILG